MFDIGTSSKQYLLQVSSPKSGLDEVNMINKEFLKCFFGSQLRWSRNWNSQRVDCDTPCCSALDLLKAGKRCCWEDGVATWIF